MRRSSPGLHGLPWLLLTPLLLVGCRSGEAPEEVPAFPAGVAPAAWFEEVAGDVGIRFRHLRALEIRYWLPEIMSGGAAWLDHDGDGDLDLYLVQGGSLARAVGRAVPGGPTPGNRLFRNDGVRFVDVTANAGVGDPGYGMGVSTADLDGDGDVDLYVTNLGPNVLYRNDGDGSFTDVTPPAGVGDGSWGASAAAADLDADGDLDLFVTNYLRWSPGQEVECFGAGGVRDYCHPNRYQAPAPDTLYRNDGSLRFTDASRDAGLHRVFGNGLGVAVVDFDGDGRSDVYVANDSMPNQLWLQGPDGLEERAVPLGCAVNLAGDAEAGMGVGVGDVDGDGSFDLLLTHLDRETNTLYLNRQGLCDDATAAAGLATSSLGRTGFGTALADLDLDGRLDLWISNGRVNLQRLGPGPDPFAQPNLLYRGLPGGRFAEVALAAGDPLAEPRNGRAAAFGDHDRDGDVDVAEVNNGGPARLFRNLAADAGPGSAGKGSWLGVRLLGDAGQDALGGWLRVTSAGRSHRAPVEGAYSYCASNDPALILGAGSPVVEELEAVWPDGRHRLYRSIPASRYLILFP